jgi:N-acetylneuraminate synthase
VIAEAGSNHNGDLATAKQLIDVAVKAGADAVKFQTFRADEMYAQGSGSIGTVDGDAWELMRELEMPYDWIPELARYADEKSIHFLSSPFDKNSTEELSEHVPAYKIGSTLVSHHPFIKYIARQDKPLIISTGAHAIDEIDAMMAVIRECNAEGIILLQCVSSYPTPLDKMNISVLETLRTRFKIPTGLSDHTEHPTIAPIVATTLGAAVIEKHITLNKSLSGPDHSFALEPDEFYQLVRHVRGAEAAKGGGQKEILSIEQQAVENGRRCLHTTRKIFQGEILTNQDIQYLRPGTNPRGIPPSETTRVIGRAMKADLKEGVPILYEHVGL